jgi:hypothetical protein
MKKERPELSSYEGRRKEKTLLWAELLKEGGERVEIFINEHINSFNSFYPISYHGFFSSKGPVDPCDYIYLYIVGYLHN